MNKILTTLKTHRNSFFVWGGVAICMLMMQLAFPWHTDDWFYACTTWRKLLPDAFHEYCAINSRLTGLVLTRIFSLSPDVLMDVINTIGYLIFSVLVLQMAFGSRWKQLGSQWETHVLLWWLCMWFIPAGDGIFRWLCGTAFYLWPINFCFAVIVWAMRYLKPRDIVPSSWRVVFCVLPCAFIGGLGNYNFGGLVGFVLLVAWIHLLRLHSPESRKVFCVGLVVLVATAIVVCSPGPYQRINIVQDGIQHADAPTIALQSTSARIMRFLPKIIASSPLALLCMICFVWRCVKKQWTREDLCVIFGFAALIIISALPIWLMPVKGSSRAYALSFVLVCIPVLRLLLPADMFTSRWLKRCFYTALLIPIIATAYNTPSEYAVYCWWNKTKNLIAHPVGDSLQFPYLPRANAVLLADEGTGGHRIAIQTVLGVSHVSESRERCRYEGETSGVPVVGKLKDGKQIFLNNIIPSGDLGGRLSLHAEGIASASVLVAYPADEVTVWYHPHAVMKRLFHAFHTSAAADELTAMGYKIVEAPGQEGTFSLEWSVYPRAWSKPNCPDIWLAIPQRDNQEDFVLFEAHPDWK